MTSILRQKYSPLSDQDILEIVANRPAKEGYRADDGVAYLLLDRYAPLLKNIYSEVFSNSKTDYYNDCVHDLYAYLRNGEPVWRKLINIEVYAKFGSWLRTTARNRFLEYKFELIGDFPHEQSIDDTTSSPMQISTDDRARMIARIAVMEGIAKLDNDDYRFVLVKRLEGYQSKEIAEMMARMWADLNIVRYNNQGKRMMPNEKYVNSCMQHAKDRLRQLLSI